MRKKMNKADELYISANRETMTAEEISKAIDLNLKCVSEFIKNSGKKTSRLTKSARITSSNGVVIGAKLSNELADSAPFQRKSLEDSNRPHIYKSKKDKN